MGENGFIKSTPVVNESEIRRRRYTAFMADMVRNPSLKVSNSETHFLFIFKTVQLF
jgi:hypothetical protein